MIAKAFHNYGSAAQIQLNIPVWTWGAASSKIRQAELGLQQAHNDLGFTQRQLLANLNAFYLEADAASFQIGSLRHSLDLATDSLRLTRLRYQAGEVSVLEVVDAQSTLVDARNAYDDGMVRYRLAGGQPSNTHGGVLANAESYCASTHKLHPWRTPCRRGGTDHRFSWSVALADEA